VVESLYERIYEVVRRVPKGRVATYGSIARAVGMPRGARQVGYAMAALGRGAPRPDVPWHRIVNAKGESSIGEEQVSRLRAEGVEFSPDGRIELREFGWDAVESDVFGEESLFG
jgi:methylated-DNA-protein-cysteine methyltransferase related protein